jgi:hypothetical protein
MTHISQRLTLLPFVDSSLAPQCRTACGWCATQAEKDPHPEPEEIPYNRVFEMEKKKRAKMNTSIY